MREDWIEIEFGILCKFSQGIQVSKEKQYSEDNEDRIRFLRIVDFTQGTEDFRYVEKPDISNVVSKDDISMVRYGTVGFVCTGKEGAIANNLFRVIPKINIENTYLINFLKSNLFKRHIDSKGATMQALNFGLIKPIKIPLAPLPIQRAIVNKVEELFSSLDNGIADLKKAQEQLKVYRQAVLKKAFEGKWKKAIINDLFDFIGGGTPSKSKKEFWNGKIPWASVKDVKGDILHQTQDSITLEGLKNSASNLAKRGELILITRISPGKVIITNIDTAINQDLKIVKPKCESNTKFNYYLFKSIEFECTKLSSGTTVLGITLPNLKSIEVPQISYDEQTRIVEHLENKLSKCDKIEGILCENLIKAKALRQSILKKAFEGKLLSEEETEKCKKEKDYEPANVLLQKIKAEKKKK